MRSLFLYGVADRLNACAYLDGVFTKIGEGEWILGGETRPFAWLRIAEGPELYGDESDADIEPGPCILVDLSGDTPDRKADLIALLRKAQSQLGGTLRDDGDALV